MAYFDTTTRDLMQELGIRDPKTLHRRRDLYNDKSVDPRNKIFKFGFHYVRKSPVSPDIIWNRKRAIKTWLEACKFNALEDNAEKMIQQIRRA